MRIELEQEDNGRWIAEAPELPGAMAYGATQNEAVCRVKALASRITETEQHVETTQGTGNGELTPTQ